MRVYANYDLSHTNFNEEVIFYLNVERPKIGRCYKFICLLSYVQTFSLTILRMAKFYYPRS